MHAVISNRKSSFRFAVLFLIFNFLVGFLVAWLLLKPAHSSSNSATWTTKADFETNASTTNLPSALSDVKVSEKIPSENSSVILSIKETDSWTPPNIAGAPTERYRHTAVWAGSKMIIWGGGDTNARTSPTGSYDPISNTWTAISTLSAPSPRMDHTAVWTGTDMVVWGGGYGDLFKTGGLYNPLANVWKATSIENAPDARRSHTAVWTGSKMIIWGGYTSAGPVKTGGLYDLATDKWEAMSTDNAPIPRALHTAVWTGSKMIVWGGYDGANNLNSGGIYDPSTNTWETLNDDQAPEARHFHTAVWTGSKMIVWGGNKIGGWVGPSAGILNTGGVYDSVSNTWGNISNLDAPTPRHLHTAIWTGSKMVIWGGYGNSLLSSGGIYDPSTNSWYATTNNSVPTNRYWHTAIWTGSKMVIWGGIASNYLNTGAIYKPLAHYSKGAISKLTINAGDGFKGKWNSISWNGETPEGTSIKFRTKGADTEDGLASAEWSDYYIASGSSINTPPSQWLEIELTLETTDQLSTPVLNDFTVNYDKVINDTTPPTGSIVINDDAECTNNRGVTLMINAEDPGNPGPGQLEMRFSNDNENWSDWQAYETTQPWMLAAGDGEKTVYAQFKDQSGNISTSYTFKDTFDTDVFEDTANTTADWNTLHGEIKLPSVGYTDRLLANLPSARQAASAVWDPDNKVAYVFGGQDASGNLLADIVRFDPSSGTAVKLPSALPSTRYHTAAVWDPDNKVAYIFGGNRFGGAHLNDIIKFDPASGSVVKLSTALPTGLTGASAVWDTENRVAYIFGGIYDGFSKDIIKFDPYSGQATKLSITLPSIRAFTSAIWDSHNNVAYIFGGKYSTGTGNLNDEIIKFNPISGTIDKIDSTLPITLGNASAVWDPSNKVAYIFGGASNYFGSSVFNLNSVTKFDPVYGASKFVAYSSLLNDKNNTSAVWDSSNNVAYIFGGFQSQNLADIIKFGTKYQPFNNIAQSLTVDQTDVDITRATLNTTERLNGQSINYQLSRDGGITWEDIVKGQEHQFTSTSEEKSDLRWRATLNGTEDISPVILDISISYNREPISDSIILDETPPSILITSPEFRSYQDSEVIPVNYLVGDDLSGIQSEEASVTYLDDSGQQQTVTVQNGQNLNDVVDLISGRTYTLRVNATDKAGNISVQEVNFNIAISAPSITGINKGLYADAIGEFDLGWSSVSDVRDTLGVPNQKRVRLGIGGYVELKFTDNVIEEGPGADLAIFAYPFGNDLYKVSVKKPDNSGEYESLGWHKNNAQIDINGKGLHGADTIRIENTTSYTQNWPQIDAIQTIHPGPYADIAFGPVYKTSNASYALGPKDGKATILTTQAFDLYFSDNVANNGEGDDITVYEYRNDEYYYLDIDDGTGFKELKDINGKKQKFKGVESIDLSEYGMEQARAVRIKGMGSEIDAVEAIHPGAFVDAVIKSTAVDPRWAMRDDLNGNNALGPDDYGTFMESRTLIRPNQSMEFQFLDNEAINREGPDIAISRSSPSLKVYVKENRGDQDYIDITPLEGFSNVNKNIYLPENLPSVEVIKIENIDSNSHHTVGAIEALHPYKDKILTRLTSDYEVFPKDSTATITAHVTPFETDKDKLILRAYLDNSPIAGTDTEISVENNRTIKTNISFSLPAGRHRIDVRVLGEPEAKVGSISLIGGLQNAIDIAKDGDALMLSKGTFEESVKVNKSIKLKGANNQITNPIDHDTVIDGGSNSTSTIDVSASNAGLYNLTIKNSDFGIESHNNKTINVSFNNILNYKKAGMYLHDMPAAANNTEYSYFEYNYINYGQKIDCTGAIVYNKITGNKEIVKETPIGIKIDNSRVGYIEVNKIYNNVVGVKLTQGWAYLAGNYIYSNCIGIFRDPIGEDSQMDIQGNEISDTDIGIAFLQSDESVLNIFENAISDAKVGVLGIAGTANVYNNRISGSNVGIYAPLPTVKVYDNIYSNNIQDNPSALPEEIKKTVTEEILESVLSEPYYLRQRIDGYGLEKGTSTSLKSKLDSLSISLINAYANLAENKKLASNYLGSAANKVTAFQNEVKAVKEDKITAGQKDDLFVLSEILKRQLVYLKNNLI